MEASRRRPRTSGAHPRSRGENEIYNFAMKQCPGSSPLTRGKWIDWTQFLAAVGLIPAHAGKISGASQPPGTNAAHPRSRGENGRREVPAPSFLGSSPLTRGKSCPSALRTYAGGLIPAHAGKIRAPLGCARRLGAHPRSRGENEPKPRASAIRRGSSPLTRGKSVGVIKIIKRTRLIPAHAGKMTPAE